MVEQWRAVHAPGDRLFLLGKRAALVLPRAVGEELVGRLWPAFQDDPQPASLVNLLTSQGLTGLDQFALLVADGDRVRLLVRGPISVTNLDSGEVLADGDGLLTWREASLSGVRAVRVGQAEGEARLPLLLGAGLVSHVDLAFDGSEPVALVSDEPEPEPEEEPESGTTSPEEPEPEAEADESDDKDTDKDTQDAAPTPQQETQPEAERGVPQLGHVPTANPMNAQSTIIAPPGSIPNLQGRPAQAGNPGQPGPLAGVPASVSSPSMPSPSSQAPSSADHDGLTIFQRDIAATHKPQARQAQVLAAMCARGHANPPGSSQCRLCMAPVAQGAPQIVKRPPLAMLVTTQGESVVLDGPVLVGRAPSADGFDPSARLLTVPSPNQDISRTHLLVNPDGWTIEATDLHSTNGTMVRRGAEAVRLASGQPVIVRIGEVLDLGDGVQIRVMNPTM